MDSLQIELFPSPRRPVPDVPCGTSKPAAEPIFSFSDVVSDFLSTRKPPASVEARCESCGCTEAHPCKDRSGDSCSLRFQRGHYRCTADHCAVGAR